MKQLTIFDEIDRLEDQKELEVYDRYWGIYILEPEKRLVSFEHDGELEID